jgi:hypothetical protein
LQSTSPPNSSQASASDDAFEDNIDEDVKPTVKKRRSPTSTTPSPTKRTKKVTTSPTSPRAPKPKSSSAVQGTTEASTIAWTTIAGLTTEKKESLINKCLSYTAHGLGIANLAKEVSLGCLILA